MVLTAAPNNITTLANTAIRMVAILTPVPTTAMATAIPAAAMKPEMKTGKCFCLYLFLFLLTFTFGFFLLTNFFNSSYFYFFILSIDSDANLNIATKGSMINWGRPPQREKMAKSISDWTKKEGCALDVKDNSLTPNAMFVSKVGIIGN